jgi:hypothetical protein
MENISVLELLSEKLMGLNLKVCVQNKQVIQPYCVWKKKSNNVTNEQSESGNLRFRMQVHRTKPIGSHMVYDVSKIVGVEVESFEEYNYSSEDLILVLENGRRIILSLMDNLKKIDKNTYILC